MLSYERVSSGSRAGLNWERDNKGPSPAATQRGAESTQKAWIQRGRKQVAVQCSGRERWDLATSSFLSLPLVLSLPCAGEGRPRICGPTALGLVPQGHLNDSRT
eukprot:3601141-Rhodomonas_salina.2